MTVLGPVIESILDSFLDGEMAEKVVKVIRENPPQEGETCRQYVDRIKRVYSQ